MQPHQVLLSVGVILLASLVADWLGRYTVLPRVTLLVLIGVAAGPSGLDLIPPLLQQSTEIVAAFALTMVAFLLGSELSRTKLASHGREIIFVSVVVVLVTAAVVSIGLVLIGMPPALALLIGAIATSTAPAATRDVVVEIEAKGRFPDLLLGIVAVDDAWGLLLFGFAMAAAGMLVGGNGAEAGMGLLVHLGGAVLVGLVIGIPGAYLTGRVKPGQPTQMEAIGLVLVCGGLALWLDASYLLAATIAGTLVANLATHHDYAFREIEHFEWPILTIFFVLAGAAFDVSMLAAAGIFGVAYIVLRFAGRIGGGWLGGAVAGLPRNQKYFMGFGLMPQAGVAVGMGLIAAQEFPEFKDSILAITIGGTIVFEAIGPILARIALRRTAEA